MLLQKRLNWRLQEPARSFEMLFRLWSPVIFADGNQMEAIDLYTANCKWHLLKSNRLKCCENLGAHPGHFNQGLKFQLEQRQASSVCIDFGLDLQCCAA